MESTVFPPSVQQVCETLLLDPVRLALGWGDWQLIGCCNKDKVDELKDVAKSQGVSSYIIGEVIQGENVTLEHKGQVGKMAPIDSQRFTKKVLNAPPLAVGMDEPSWVRVRCPRAR